MRKLGAHESRERRRTFAVRSSAPDVSRERRLERGRIPAGECGAVGTRAPVKCVPHRLHALSDRGIADAEFTKRHIHTAEHRIEHGLGELRAQGGLVLEPIDEEEAVQANEVEPPIQRVRYPERGIKERLARGGDDLFVECRSRVLVMPPPKPEHTRPLIREIDFRGPA